MGSVGRVLYSLLLLLLLVACGNPQPNAGGTSGNAQPTNSPAQSPPTATTAPQPTTASRPTEGSQQQPTAVPTEQAAAPQPTTAPTQQAPAPQPSAAPQIPQRSIQLSQPQQGATVSSPVQVSGHVSVSPFEATLTGTVYDAQGNILGQGPIQVAAELGQPGDFNGEIAFKQPSTDTGRIEIAEFSAKDGSVVVSTSVNVTFNRQGGGNGCLGAGESLPAAGAQTALPLHMQIPALGNPGDQVKASIVWANGVRLEERFRLIGDRQGCGLLIGNLNWSTESQPPQPAERDATFEVYNAAGSLLYSAKISVLRWDDQDTMMVPVTWLSGEQLQTAQSRVIRTDRVGAAALEQLLWGPDPGNLAGFTTAIPSPEEIVRFPGRQADWEPRVRLLGLTIQDGVATANFSKEMQAYGGGSLRTQQIREQITQTLKAFPTVSEVRIAIEGRTEGVLQP